MISRSISAKSGTLARVLLLGETFGRIKGSGVPVRQPLGAVYSSFRDRQIVDQRNFLTWDQAIEAAGLSE